MQNFFGYYPQKNSCFQNISSKSQPNLSPPPQSKTPPPCPPHTPPPSLDVHCNKNLNPPSPSAFKTSPPPRKQIQRKKFPKKKKFDFKCIKNDACSSLNDVECFLNNFSNFIKYIKLINLLK